MSDAGFEYQQSVGAEKAYSLMDSIRRQILNKYQDI